MPQLSALLLLLPCLLCAGGCGNPLSAGLEAFDEARYPDAIEQLRSVEANVPDLDPAERNRYALYRGLSHLAAGDARQATRWLGRAKAALDADPHAYDARETGQLVAAWRSMGKMPGEPGR